MTNKQAKYIYDFPLNNLINKDKIFVFYFIFIKMVTVLFLTFLYAGLAQVGWFRLHFHISFITLFKIQFLNRLFGIILTHMSIF